MAPTRSSVAALLLVGAVLLGIVVLSRSGASSDGRASAVASGQGSTQAATGSAVVATPADSGPADSRPARALDPGLVAAYERARAAAAEAGHDLVINSGYRTPARQQELLDEEIVKRGSFEAASRWVFTPDRSMHVQGLAIDVGDGHAADWLTEHGAPFGLCHTLSWEWWHFEWRQRWQDAGRCPPEAQDPAEAPGR